MQIDNIKEWGLNKKFFDKMYKFDKIKMHISVCRSNTKNSDGTLSEFYTIIRTQHLFN